MKNQLFTEKVLSRNILVLIFSLGVILSILLPNRSFANGDTTVITGKVYIYKSVDDTLSVIAQDGIIKFYKKNSNGNMILKAEASLDENGDYVATVIGTSDLYILVWPEDPVESDFVASYYPGWLDYESADAISTSEAVNGVIDYDWGAVGKEIVERPAGAQDNNIVSGTVSTSTPLIQDKVGDFVPMVYVLNGDDVLASAPVGTDGRYTLSFFGSGNYEIFSSIPGFASQSKYISTTNTRGDFNVNFNLDVYRGETETTPVNTVANNFSLNQNYPNPFNPTTKINFTLNVEGKVKLTVYNSLGKQVAALINDLMEPGTYDIPFSGNNLSSGVYYYTLQVGNHVETKRMSLIK